MKVMITSAKYGMDYEGLCVKEFDTFEDFVSWKKSVGRPVVFCENYWMEGFTETEDYDEFVENFGEKMTKDLFESYYQAIIIDDDNLEDEVLSYYLK